MSIYLSRCCQPTLRRPTDQYGNNQSITPLTHYLKLVIKYFQFPV